MADIVIMPKLGFNMDEGRLVRWYVKEGEEVSKGKPLFSIETDKTNIDIEATGGGVLRKILLAEGETSPVTLPIAVIADRDENIDAILSELVGKEKAASQSNTNQTSSETVKVSDAVSGSWGTVGAPADSSEGRDFDVAVIGGGPGGYVAAIKAAQLGKKVAIVENGRFGGVCLNRGCIPTKVMLKSAAILRDVKNSKDYGIAGISGNATLDMNAVQLRKEKIVSQLSGGVEGLLKANGVTIFKGKGELRDTHTVAVGEKRVTTEYIVIATGSSVKPFPVPSDPGMKVMTSDEALELKEIPESIVIVGGGVIGLEFACFFTDAGSRVSVIEFLDRVLPPADHEISAEAEQMLREKKADVYTGARVSAITAHAVQFEKDGRTESVETSAVLISAGRIPDTGSIDCRALGITTDRGAIVTDSSMRTSVANIFAIGDVNGKAMLAHTASAEAIVAVETICGHSSAMSYDTIPSIVFTCPEIAWVGLTETQARAKFGKVKVGKFPITANGKSKVNGEERGFIKVIVTEEYNEIVGVHMFCDHASDMIAEAVVAMELESAAEEIAKSVHPHPTVSEAVQEAFHAALDKAIHFFG